jgi:hypothetical protein
MLEGSETESWVPKPQVNIVIHNTSESWRLTWVPKPQEVEMGTQGNSRSLLYMRESTVTWQESESSSISRSAIRNSILSSESSGLGAQSATESSSRCTWCMSQPSCDMSPHHMTSPMVHHMTCTWHLMWLITWPLDLEKKTSYMHCKGEKQKTFHGINHHNLTARWIFKVVITNKMAKFT